MGHPDGGFDRDILDIIPERFDADADSHEARKGHRLRSALTLLVAVLVVGGIVAAGLHFIGGRRGAGAGIPVIKADERPIKVRPDDRGGMQVPNQDKLVYERMEGSDDAKVEQLLPQAEAPKAPPKPVAAQPPAAAPAPAPQAEMLRPPTGAKPGEPPAPKAAPQQSVAMEPPSVASLPPAVAPAAPAPAPVQAPAAVAPAPVVQPPAAPAKPVVSPPALPAVPAPAPAVPKPAAVAPPPPPAAAAPKAPASGDYVIQLGALRASADAEKEWARIQRTNHDVLGALKPDIVRVELGDKGTFWRLRAGPLSEQAARQLCQELSTRNQGCIVARK
jgi:cell division septation protein DedD